MSGVLEAVGIVLIVMIGAAISTAILLMLVNVILDLAGDVKDQIEYLRRDDDK